MFRSVKWIIAVFFVVVAVVRCVTTPSGAVSMASPLVGYIQSDEASAQDGKRSSIPLFVFVHGILSSASGCWTNPDSGTYWPEMVRKSYFGVVSDGFGAPTSSGVKPDVFVFDYDTSIKGGEFDVDDAANQLAMELDGVQSLRDREVVYFVSHSLGGLVLAQYLGGQRSKTQLVGKCVGCAFYSTPFGGADLATRLDWLRRLFGNKMSGSIVEGAVLKYAKKVSDWQAAESQKRRIAAFTETRKTDLDTFWLIPLWSELLVTRESASLPGVSAVGISGEDHQSIVKPDGEGDKPHQNLVDAFRQFSVMVPCFGGSSSAHMLKINLEPNPTFFPVLEVGETITFAVSWVLTKEDGTELARYVDGGGVDVGSSSRVWSHGDVAEKRINTTTNGLEIPIKVQNIGSNFDLRLRISCRSSRESAGLHAQPAFTQFINASLKIGTESITKFDSIVGLGVDIKIKSIVE